MSEKKRFTEIDALRGIAAIIVVLYHYIILYDEKFGHIKENYIEIFSFDITYSCFYNQRLCDLHVCPKGKINVRFLTKGQSVCIQLIFLLLLSLLLSSVYLRRHLKTGAADMLVNLTMFQDFFGFKNVDGVYWSLRVELTFYLLMAMLLSLTERNVMIFTGLWLRCQQHPTDKWNRGY